MMIQHHEDGNAFGKKELVNGMSDKLKQMVKKEASSQTRGNRVIAGSIKIKIIILIKALEEDTYNTQTNWYVITGGPGSGKTTTVNLLKDMGYKTTIEHARHYIDTMLVKGRTVEEIRMNQIVFQSGILDMQIKEEQSLSPDEIFFLDRAIPDALAYYRFLNIPENEKLENAMKNAKYKKIFILDPLPLINDYARTEDASEQKKIHILITEVYESLGFPVIHVPVLPPKDRVNFILENLNVVNNEVDRKLGL